MAPYFSFISFLLVTFLMAQARELPLGEISLEQEPEQSYYIVKKRPAVIVCKARNAVDITFTCAGTQIPPTSVEMEDMSDVDPEVIQAKIEVTRADVQNYDDSQGAFWCECSALDIDGQPAVTSRRSFITVAHLKHRFSSHPQSRQASEGENVEFICGAPVGDPKPEILWRKDKKRLNIKENSRLVVTDQGSLVIESATQEDSGLYQCVAKNPAGRRESKEAKLTVSVYAESSEPAEEVSAGESSESRIRNPRQSEKKTYFSTLPQDSYYIRPDEKVTMECEATAADILTFRCNGQRMQRHQMQTEQGTDNAGNRVIKSVLTVEYADVRDYYSKAGDSSSYACVCVAWYQDATNPRGWGHISSDENVGIVLLSYLDRTFQVEPSDLTVGVNTDAVLLCEPPKGQPSPWVYWFKDRVRLDPRSDDHYSINAKGHLTIHRVQYDDSGVYNCLAENTVDQIQSKRARLIVTAEAPATTAAPVASMEDTIPSFPDQIPDFPVFLNDLKPQYDITSGDRATLVCSVVSADQLTFLCGQARIDSKDLKKSDSQYDNESGKRLLYASYEVTEDVLSGASDDFYCQCTAWYLNADGKWQMLQGNKGFVNLVEGEEREPEPKTYINDDFVYEPTDLTVDFEGEAELACEPPQGYPEPTVYWTKDGVKIKPELDSNFIVLEEGPLIIEYVRLGDEGMYTCVAENSAGSRVSRPMQLTVRGKPTTLPPTTPTTPMTPTPEPTDEDITDGTDLYPTTSDYYDYTAIKLTEPLFSMEPKEASYIVNDLPITLSCSVVAAKSLVFACNDEVVDETVKTGYLTIEPTSQQEIRDNSLTITKEQVEAWTGSDPFSCTCRGYYLAEGAEAGDWSFVESRAGTIQIAFFKKRFMMEPVSQNVQQGEDAELRCKAPAGVPTPTVYWLKDGYRLNEDETVMINEQGSLMIKGFSAKDEGDYTCVAENMLKRRTSKTASIRLAAAIEEVIVPDEGKDTEGAPGGDAEPSSEPEPETTPWTGVVAKPPGTPYISKELHSVYYIIKNKPTKVMCEAYNVDYITFSCGMENIEVKATRERAEEFVQLDGSIVMQNVVEAFITLRRDRIEKYDDGQDYWCQCYAHYSVPGMEDEQILSSQKGYVEIAFIRKNFQKSPQNQFVKQGEFLSIECRPPIGNPQPKVSWLKNGEPVEALNVLPNGALIFESAQPEDGGNYQCVAQNEAGRRSSERILVEVEAMEGAVVVGGGGVDTEEGLGGEEVEGEIVEGTIVDGDEVIVTGEPEGEAEDKQEGEGVVIVGESEPTGEPDSDKTGEEFVVAEGEPTGEPDSDETGGEVVVEEGEPEGETSEDQTGEAVVVGEGGDPEGEAEDKQEGEDVVVVGEVEPTGEPDDGQKGEGVVVVAEGEPTGETQDGGEGYAEETTEEEGEAEENQEGVIVVAGGIPEGEDVEPEEGKGEDQMGAGEAEGVMDGEKEEGTQGERKSETVDEEEYVTQVVPEIEVPSTPEDDSVSEVEVGATPEEDSTPANEVVISFEDDSDPEKEIVISVEDNSTPEGEVDISDEDNSDPESEVVIAEEDHSDPESEVVVAEEDHSDPESEVVIAEEDHSDPESEVVIAEEDHSDPESEVVIAEEDHSDPESEVVIAEEDNNDPKNEVGISVKEDSTPESEVGISVEDNTTFQSEVGISVEDNTDPENEVGISAKDNSAPESEAGASVEDDSAPENEVGTTTEEGTQSEKGEEEEEDDIGFETVVVYEGDYRDTLEKEPVEEVPKGEVDMDQIGGATGDKTCMAMLNTCQKVLPPNTDATVVCKKFDEYKECTDRFMKACTGILSEESMNAVKMARMNVEQNCMAITSQCPKLEQCKLIYSNVLDDSAGSSGLPVQSFCMDIDSFLRCVDQTLLDCNVSMTSPGDMKPSLSSIGTWFEEYCDGLIMGSNSIASCDQIVSCDLKFTQVAGDNSTYWCRMMDSLLQCTENAVDTCGLDELRDDLTYLHDQAKQFSCGEHMGTGTDYNPEEPAVGEPEVDTEPEANGSKDGGNDYGGQPDAETDGADPEGDDKEMEEGETGSVSDPDKENGATSMSKSAILAIFMQLILATLLSWR